MVAALKHLATATLLAVFGAGVASAQSDAQRQRAKDAIVMMRTQLPDGTQMGAGIIVAVTAREVYVATANHMVRRGGGRASSIELQFASAPGRWVNATLLDFLDRDLDVAAVVAPLPANFNGAALKTIFAGPAQQLRREMDVYALGYPRERLWNLSVVPDKVASTTTSRIVFQSNFVQPGNSGGALLDGCGRIVGMVTETDPPEATAVRVDSVLDLVRSWNLPTQPSLAATASPCGAVPPGGGRPDTVIAEGPSAPPAAAPAAAPPPATCSVTINSTPTGASIDLDGARSGTTSRTLTLTRGRRYNLRLSKTGFEAIDREIDCDSNPVRATLDAADTDITLTYLGDPYACVLQLQVRIGDTTGVPTSNFFTMKNVPLGRQNYTINGQIGCVQLGSCTARGQGTLTVDEGDNYNVVWANSGIGQCQVTLVKP